MFVCQALQLTHCCCCLCCCCCCCCCCVSLAKSSSIGQSLFVYLTSVTPLALALAFDRNCQQFTPRLQPATSSWLTIIVNLAYGFFIVASSPVAPDRPPRPLATLLLSCADHKSYLLPGSAVTLRATCLRCSPSVASTVSVIKSNYSNYYLIIIGTGQVAQSHSCPVAYLPIRPVAIPIPQTDPR